MEAQWMARLNGEPSKNKRLWILVSGRVVLFVNNWSIIKSDFKLIPGLSCLPLTPPQQVSL